jgi:hypothetical protein
MYQPPSEKYQTPRALLAPIALGVVTGVSQQTTIVARSGRSSFDPDIYGCPYLPTVNFYNRTILSYLAFALFASAAPEDHLIGGAPKSSENIQVVECIGYIAGYSQV